MIKMEASKPGWEETTIKNLSKRKAEEILAGEYETVKDFEEKTTGWNGLNTMLWRWWGGREFEKYYFQELRLLALARQYIALGGEFEERKRTEGEMAELARLRIQLVNEYGLNPYQQRVFDEVIEIQRELDKKLPKEQ